MNTHILIFSCPHDVPYLEYCLRSIDKFATGFTGVTVAVDKRDVNAFDDLARKHTFNLLTYDGPEDRIKGHIAHQAEKCRADIYVPPDTDLVAFIDSDCVFVEPVSPSDYIHDGRPELVIERFDSITGNPWQAPTQEIIGRPVDYECMRRHMIIHYTKMFPELRAKVESVQGMEFVPFILTRKPTFPWGVSELCLMGAFVLMGEWIGKYDIIDITGKKPHPPSSKKLVQFWSHSPIDKPQSTPWDLKLVPLEFCKKLGL